jgi:hypothetical protein
MKHVILLVTLGSVAIGSTGCGVMLPSSDSFVMYGTESSLRAYHDSLNGLISNSRTTDPLGDSAYWQARKEQETEKTKRGCNNCGFFNKLMGGAQKFEREPKEVAGS